MKVGIFGSGDVGQHLATAFADLGHEVMLGAREANNEKITAWAKKTGGNAKAGSFADVAAFGELLVISTMARVTGDVLRAAGEANLRGKILIDTTNPIEYVEGKPVMVINGNDSSGERVQQLAPSAKVVKCFNTIGAANMYKPKLETKPDMFICGNDEGAKKWVSELLPSFGWGVVDIGGIEASRSLEHVCMAWLLYGLKTNDWSRAYKLIGGAK